jgi:sialate O-acetylesterase
MVLQRDAPARIWGSATGEVTVTVSGGGGTEIQTTKAATNGSWSVDLRPRNATVAPSQITVACPSCTAAADKQVVLTDVLFGDVFVCGGQSNMAFGLGQDINASLECPATAGFPHIRHTTFSSTAFKTYGSRFALILAY